MSKAELARKAGLSTLTIDRVEAGRPCRLDTKRKILLALGLKVSDKDRIFGAAEDADAESERVARPHPADRPVFAGGGSHATGGAHTGSDAGPLPGRTAGKGEGIR